MNHKKGNIDTLLYCISTDKYNLLRDGENRFKYAIRKACCKLYFRLKGGTE